MNEANAANANAADANTGSTNPELTASNLKGALWGTLNCLTRGQIQPAEADAIASQAREITRIVRVQLQVAKQTNRDVPIEVISFSER